MSAAKTIETEEDAVNAIAGTLSHGPSARVGLALAQAIMESLTAAGFAIVRRA
jgi:hypothetical protein